MNTTPNPANSPTPSDNNGKGGDAQPPNPTPNPNININGKGNGNSHTPNGATPAGGGAAPNPSLEEQFLAVFNQSYLLATEATSTNAQKLAGLSQMISMLTLAKNQNIIKRLDSQLAQEIREATFKLARESPVLEWLAQVCEIEWTPTTNPTLAPTPSSPAPSVSPSEITAPAENQLEVASIPNNDSNGAKRWTRASVLALINEPIDAETYGRIMGSKRTHPFYISSSNRIPRLLALLKTHGPLTVYQLTAFFLGREDNFFGKLPQTILTNVRRNLLLAQIKYLVKTQIISGPNPLKLWSLDRPGEIHLAMLEENGGISPTSDPVAEFQSEHSFGTNQVLAAMASASGTANTLGLIEHVTRTAMDQLGIVAGSRLSSEEQEQLKLPALPLPSLLEWVRQIKPEQRELVAPNFGCSLELGERNQKLLISTESKEYNRPDAMGRLAYDGRWCIPTVLAATNIPSNSGEEGANFVFSNLTTRRYWPFVLEYDRASENHKDYEKKAVDYTKIYNTLKTDWPAQWGGQFPTILVVTEGGPGFILTLRSHILTDLIEFKRTQVAIELNYNWWFTSIEWFNQVFEPYLDPEKLGEWYSHIYPKLNMGANKGRESKGETVVDTAYSQKGSNKNSLNEESRERGLVLAPDPHIWLPLSTKAEKDDLMELDRYFKSFRHNGASLVKKANSFSQLPPPPGIVKSMRALPIFMPFNHYS